MSAAQEFQVYVNSGTLGVVLLILGYILYSGLPGVITQANERIKMISDELTQIRFSATKTADKLDVLLATDHIHRPEFYVQIQRIDRVIERQAEVIAVLNLHKFHVRDDLFSGSNNA